MEFYLIKEFRSGRITTGLALRDEDGEKPFEGSDGRWYGWRQICDDGGSLFNRDGQPTGYYTESPGQEPTDYAPRTAADVTPELVAITVDIVDGWYARGRIDWEDVLDRVEDCELPDGRTIDLGTDMGSGAVEALKRRVRDARKES